MTPYIVIGIIIAGLGVVQTIAWRRASARKAWWYQVRLLAMYLEALARAARSRQRNKDAATKKVEP